MNKQRIFLLVIFFCLTLVVAVGIYKKAQPKLEVQSTLDLGEIAPRNSRNIALDVSNTGLFPLTIKNLTASCGCTKVNLAPDKLGFNQHGKLTLNVYAGSYVGLKIVNVAIQSNDTCQPTQNILVKMMVNDVLSVLPDHVQLGTITQENLPLSNEIVIKPGLHTVIPDDLNVTFDRDYLSVKLEKDAIHNYYLIKYALAQSTPCGLISANIFINSKKLNYSLRIPVDGLIAGNLSAEPEYVFLAQVGSDDEHQFRVDFNKKITMPYKIRILPEALSNMLIVQVQPSYFILKAKDVAVNFQGSGIAAIINGDDNHPIYEVPLYSGL